MYLLFLSHTSTVNIKGADPWGEVVAACCVSTKRESSFAHEPKTTQPIPLQYCEKRVHKKTRHPTPSTCRVGLLPPDELR